MMHAISGALSIDESIALAQGVCSGNASSAIFSLLPQPHSSCNFSTVLKHRRLIEDKVVSNLSSISNRCTVATRNSFESKMGSVVLI